jgi:hypothetical protein
MSPVVDVETIEHDSITASIAEVVGYLKEHVGQQVVAYLAGLENPKMLGRWQEGTEPRAAARMRLRYAYQAVRMLIETYDDQTAEAWLFGSNTKLDDNAPAWVLRRATKVDELRLLIPAVKAFARSSE